MKHLGHSLSNLTKALTTDLKKEPQLVTQLRKAGGSRQANKTCRLTNEGVIYVQDMLSARED